VNNCGSLANTTDHILPIDSFEQTFKVRILLRLIPHDGILNTNTNAVIDKACYGIEAGKLLRAKVTFLLEIDDQVSAHCVGDITIATLQTFGVARISTRQHHGSREPMLS